MAHPVVHFEIPADDVERLKRFYSDLFGWSMKMDPAMPEYVMIETMTEGQGINGGMMKRQMPQHTPTNYVMVESVAEYAEKARQLGGQVVVPKTAIPKMGYFAVCLDPDRNPIGLFEMDPNAA
jgi:predicted enzyme related to lactoylglutathione lyase